MVKIDLILSIVIGLAIFLTDLAFGWLTYICGPIPVIFIMAIIIGAIAGSHGEALIATTITWVGGILLGMLLAPIIFAAYWNPDQSLLGSFIFVFIYSIRGFWDISYEGNFFEILVISIFLILVMLIITPILYLISFAFAPLGVVIGKFVRRHVGGRTPKQKPVTQETPVMTSTPVEEPTIADEPIEQEPIEDVSEEEPIEEDEQADNTEF